MTQSTAIVWFRRDLRLGNNPALTYAIQHHDRILPVYIHAPNEAGTWREGAASQWWLHHSLTSLKHSLQTLGADLILRQGMTTLDVLQTISGETRIDAIYWNRLYTPWGITRDMAIKQQLNAGGITTKSFNASLLLEPHQIVKPDGAPYKVFTAYWKRCCAHGIHQAEHPRPSRVPYTKLIPGVSVDALGLLPHDPSGWHHKLSRVWQPGEQPAHERLLEFLADGVNEYEEQRDRPDKSGTSQLSPHLHFGEISPHTIINQADIIMPQRTAGAQQSIHRLISEIGWREFAHYVLYHFPDTTEHSMNPKFRHFPWRQNSEALRRWQRGQTGVPIIDAGMRQLWQTGWMHNRVRMLVASFLTKNLLIHWLEGARWFWDTLVDADLASNTLGWQWVAGCGTDAAPYFRIFNPVLQSRKFDPDGHYIRRWVPELATLDNKQIHEPWKYKTDTRYPAPLTDLAQSRNNALQIYQSLGARHCERSEATQK